MKSDMLMDAFGFISDEIIQDAKASTQMPKSNWFVKAATMAATALLCITVPVPVLVAANVEPAYEILYQISPEMAQKFKPVKMSCEDKGIRMEVISAYIHENEVEIYIMLKDLTGNRIDATTDLFDSYRINTPFDCSATCYMVEYDEKASSATFLIHISQWDEKTIENDKLTFFVTELLSGKYKYNNILSEIDLSSVSTNPATQTDVALRGSSYLGEEPDWESLKYLAADKEVLYSPVEGVSVTAMGFIDYKLHIQVYYEDILRTDNHGYVYFIDNNENEIDSEYTVGFWDGERCGSFEEYVFDISPEELADCKLYGNFTTCNTQISGNWQVTFPLKYEE